VRRKPGRAAAALAFAAAAAAWSGGARAEVRQVAVASSRVRLGDVLAAAPAGAADLDLGPAPPPGGSRLLTRDELRRALEGSGAGAGLKLPEAVRVVRKTRRLSGAELERLVRDELGRGPLPKGASLVGVRPPASAEAPEGCERTAVEPPPMPRRAGPYAAPVVVTFYCDGAPAARLTVPSNFSLSAEAATPDVARGAPLTLVLARGLVEVATTAVAGGEGDVGAVIPVTVRPSGRVLRARLVAKDRAVAVEGP
jgi:hypothetical protein